MSAVTDADCPIACLVEILRTLIKYPTSRAGRRAAAGLRTAWDVVAVCAVLGADTLAGVIPARDANRVAAHCDAFLKLTGGRP